MLELKELKNEDSLRQLKFGVKMAIRPEGILHFEQRADKGGIERERRLAQVLEETCNERGEVLGVEIEVTSHEVDLHEGTDFFVAVETKRGPFVFPVNLEVSARVRSRPSSQDPKISNYASLRRYPRVLVVPIQQKVFDRLSTEPTALSIFFLTQVAQKAWEDLQALQFRYSGTKEKLPYDLGENAEAAIKRLSDSATETFGTLNPHSLSARLLHETMLPRVA